MVNSETILTDVTSKVHKDVYPAIDSSRPELTQAGRTVMITGGSDGIGLAIAKAFITASAANVIIVGRGLAKLEKSKAELEGLAKGKETRIIAESCDVTSKDAVDSLWSGLANKGITVNVLVLNSASVPQPKPLLDLDEGELWSAFEGNARAPYDFARKFKQQPGDDHRSLLYTSTMGINLFFDWQLREATERPGYLMTKNAGTLMMQMIAKDTDPAKMQIIPFHPGNIWTTAFQDLGVPKDSFPFEEVALPGAFAVWAASEEARFLHGRFVWATWDVEEIKSDKFKKQLEADPFYLHIGVTGLEGGFKAKTYKPLV
jgi:NAD(P)-dependent dehydrogenase (short-subunit alcohol dehydrogenase family)